MYTGLYYPPQNRPTKSMSEMGAGQWKQCSFHLVTNALEVELLGVGSAMCKSKLCPCLQSQGHPAVPERRAAQQLAGEHGGDWQAPRTATRKLCPECALASPAAPSLPKTALGASQKDPGVILKTGKCRPRVSCFLQNFQYLFSKNKNQRFLLLQNFLFYMS